MSEELVDVRRIVYSMRYGCGSLMMVSSGDTEDKLMLAIVTQVATE